MLKMAVMQLVFPPVPAVLVVMVGLVNVVYLRCNGSTKIAAWALVVILHFGLAYAGFINGGFQGPTIILAPIIPILTVLLLNGRAAWISAVLVCLTLIALLALGLTGVLPDNPNEINRILFARFMTLSSLCLISTWVVWHFAHDSRVLLKRLEVQSNTDYLTGSLNRRAIETTLLQELARARRNGSCLSLIMTDVDFFKRYNDSNGHQAGDSCLIKVSNIIRSCCKRPTDVVGRFGGEEFVLILPDTNIEGACTLAESIRCEILEQKIPYQADDSMVLSLTFGVVSVCGNEVVNMEQLIKQADDALYRGKRQGRNCVVTAALGDALVDHDAKETVGLA
jgi:diguanylate cyclase (GGDEF)-like protein